VISSISRPHLCVEPLAAEALGGQADDWWFTGKLEEIVTATENNRKVTYYDCYYDMPDGTTKFGRNKSIFHYQGKWENVSREVGKCYSAATSFDSWCRAITRLYRFAACKSITQ
jgi:hypothetical protein